jgi:hypoxanthine-DNA glycosylase
LVNLTPQTVTHTFAPIFHTNDRLLILGSFPSVKSREESFYYGHPRNRFWKVLATLFETSTPQTIEEKLDFLELHRIALWDVVSRCSIIGSSDVSIKDVIPTDLTKILHSQPDIPIFANGATAGKLYRKYQQPIIQKEITILPSTSPANASYSLEKLVDAWRMVKTQCS